MKRINGISLQRQIEDHLRMEINNLSYGAQIETEQQLAERFGASRGTIRNAVSTLVNEGLLYKLQGRGTFKGGAAVQHATYFVSSFTEQILASGMAPGIADITLDIVAASPDIAYELDVAIGAEIWRLRRIRLANGTPIAVGTAFIRRDLLPQLSPDDLTMSFIQMIRETYHIPICRTKSYCTASLANVDLARSLHIAPNAAIFCHRHYGYTTGLIPLFLDITEAIGERYALRLEQPAERHAHPSAPEY